MAFCKRSPSEAKLGNHKMVKFKEIMFTKQRRWLYLFLGVFRVKIRLRVRVLFLILKDSLGINALLPSSLTVWGLTSKSTSPNLQVLMGNKINDSAGLMEWLWGSVILHNAWFAGSVSGDVRKLHQRPLSVPKWHSSRCLDVSLHRTSFSAFSPFLYSNKKSKHWNFDKNIFHTNSCTRNYFMFRAMKSYINLYSSNS